MTTSTLVYLSALLSTHIPARSTRRSSIYSPTAYTIPYIQFDFARHPAASPYQLCGTPHCQSISSLVHHRKLPGSILRIFYTPRHSLYSSLLPFPQFLSCHFYSLPLLTFYPTPSHSLPFYLLPLEVGSFKSS